MEALVFLPYGTAIPRVDKGSVLRPKVYKDFEKAIEGMYARLEGEEEPEGKRRTEGEAEAKVVVREVIGRTIERSIDGLEDDTDLFEFGLDSLQSTRIRNAIQRVRVRVFIFDYTPPNRSSLWTIGRKTKIVSIY